MVNLRITNVDVIDSTHIDVTFSDKLSTTLINANVSILANTPNVPNSQVISLSVSQNILSIICQPLTQLAAYFLQFQSVPLHPFESLHGDAILPMDGVSNKYFITAPMDSNNPVTNFLQSFFKGNVYNIEDDNAVVSKYLQSLAINLARALYDIRQSKNENYLSFTVIDEQQTRGSGAFDRLNEESAYEIIRIGRTPSATNAQQTLVVDDFPSFPITLQQQNNSETQKPNSIDLVGVFNISTLTFNLIQAPITKVTSIIFTLATSSSTYVYNIEDLGYQLFNSEYDQDFAFTYLTLANNQVRLSSQVLQDPNFVIDQIIKVDIQYQYKDLGIIIDTDTVTITTVLSSNREALPPIVNVFTLQHAPIVDGNGNPGSVGDIIFLDPNNSPGIPHPAFTTEIIFRFNALPSLPGQYAVDYASSTVYVFGSDQNNDGTGAFPPLATYQYLLTYKSEQDYVLDTDSYDIVALPLGNLLNNPGNINFSYEQVLIPNVDYKAELHLESLNERIGNKLLALNALQTSNSPITDVFRIYNETSGEIYTLDRWENNTVYFRYNTPPRINTQIQERATFQIVSNELLFVNSTILNSSSIRIFEILLNNNDIIANSEDAFATSFNTSLVFTNNNIFIVEKWFGRDLSLSENLDRLSVIGEYMIDYINGIVYVAVSNTQSFELDTVSYKEDVIVPQFPHLITVDDIYYRISTLNPKNKKFNYTSFGDGSIAPETLDYSDELYLNNNLGAAYQINNGVVGIFTDEGFLSGVTNQIKFIRSIFEYDDLLNSTAPFNFASASLANNFSLAVNSFNQQFFSNVQYDGTHYYVLINQNIPYLSPNITYTFSVIRTSDSAQLWNGSGTIMAGNPLKLILSGINSPMSGDRVNITYSLTINNLSRIVIDYNKGDLFIDYTYLNDEILVSYEWGDNVLDFRQTQTVSPGDLYYVSYKVGALRDALLQNFGTLVNIPDLSTFDVSLDRERYREALQAALSSFIQGPTISAIKNIGKIISHIEPQIIESIFQNWSLGNSLLTPAPITTTGSFQLLPAKYDNGVLINQDDQTITFPRISNLRLEEGTFETWIVPQWNGLSNDAPLTFNILQNGSNIMPARVFVGAQEMHPDITNGSFILTNAEASGTPNTNLDGIFIYYDKDISGSFNRWYLAISDGYTGSASSTYKIKITSDGKFYDVKSILQPQPSNLTIFSGTTSINLTFAGGSPYIETITFLADFDHYLLDFGRAPDQERVSILKDVSGFISFRVFDRYKKSYYVSADVSSWLPASLHHVAASWKLNTRNNQDEMHLFIDGLEVPNIIKYGQKLNPYLHEKFRTIDPEEVLGLATRDIVASTDLNTIAGNNTVSSAINFSGLNIFAGDIIYIDEVGFDPNGYTILSVSGQSLELNQTMPLTLVSDGKFSINRTQYPVLSDIDTAPNIAVATIHYLVRGSDLGGSSGGSTVSSASINFTTHGVIPGDVIHIDTLSLPITISILQVSGNTLIIDDTLSAPLSGANFWIYTNQENEIPGTRALFPAYSISQDINFNNILTVSNDIEAGDLILIRTLGINHREIKKQYYVWSDGYENVLMTQLPTPISLNEVEILKVILSSTVVGPATATFGGGVFTSNNFTTTQPTNQIVGRTLTVTISGTNVDFTSSVQVHINGVSGGSPITETITFTDYGSLDTVHLYTEVNYVNVVVKPINSAKNALAIDVKEKYNITYSENDGYAPTIRYSYQINAGYYLSGSGFTVLDTTQSFSEGDVDNYLRIISPAPAAGFYLITNVGVNSLTIQPIGNSPSPLPSFTDGVYQILNTTEYRSGLQNGFFNFEQFLQPGQPYFLSQGFYQLTYQTYLQAKFAPLSVPVFLGTDLNGNNQINAIIDQVKIYSIMLTDTRVGETIPNNQTSITKDYNSLKPLKADNNTLMLLSFGSFPFINTADFYIHTINESPLFHSSVVINENFQNSLVILNQPLIIENDGILDIKKEGTIEFWLSPIYDSANDPNIRTYFDASSALTETTISINNTALKLSNSASQILGIYLPGNQKINFADGATINIDTQNAIQEESISIGNSSVIVGNPILQVISVIIIGDLTYTDYFQNGVIGTDQKTIYLAKTLPENDLPLLITYQSTTNNNNQLNTQIVRLNRRLPAQNTTVLVKYIPKGMQGDRISIFKDTFGYINFSILASGTEYLVRGPTRWAKNTWHRIKASYKINGGFNTDELRLFLDGYQYSNLLFGQGAIYGNTPFIFGTSLLGDGYQLTGNITFKDPINQLFIGTQYDQTAPAFTLIDNLRISNISRPLYAPYGEPTDINYNSNLNIVFPVTQDLYTTYLLDSQDTLILNTDFAVLEDPGNGSFDFTVNTFDQFDIINSSAKIKEIYETLIQILKPANSRVAIKYVGN